MCALYRSLGPLIENAITQAKYDSGSDEVDGAGVR